MYFKIYGIENNVHIEAQWYEQNQINSPHPVFWFEISQCMLVYTGKREGGGGCYIFFKMNNRIYLCLDLKKRNTNMLQNLDDWIMISNPYYNLK